jgi:hypothetical protein
MGEGLFVRQVTPLSQLTTEQKLALLEAMGIPVDNFVAVKIQKNSMYKNMSYPSGLSLCEFIERGK